MDPLSVCVALGAAGATGGAAAPVAFDDVFSTDLITATGSAIAVNNGIDFTGEGGFVWFKLRDSTDLHAIVDTERPGTSSNVNAIFPDSSAAQISYGSNMLGAFSSTGFTAQTGFGSTGDDSVYWSFRQAPGFHSIATWTGNGSTSRSISHNLDSVPGTIFIKNLSNAFSWVVYHRSLGSTQKLHLNETGSPQSENNDFGGLSPTSTTFGVGYGTTNIDTNNYIAYLFAHDDARFGTNQDENIINCGSYTGTGANLNVDCGFASGARFVIIRRTDAGGDWYMYDTTRGIVSGNDPYLLANSNAAEVTNTDYINPLNAGFTITSSAPAALNTSSGNYIFIAIGS